MAKLDKIVRPRYSARPMYSYAKAENWTRGYAALRAAVLLLRPELRDVILAVLPYARRTKRKRWWIPGLRHYARMTQCSMKTAARRWQDALAELRDHAVLKDYLGRPRRSEYSVADYCDLRRETPGIDGEQRVAFGWFLQFGELEEVARGPRRTERTMRRVWPDWSYKGKCPFSWTFASWPKEDRIELQSLAWRAARNWKPWELKVGPGEGIGPLGSCKTFAATVHPYASPLLPPEAIAVALAAYKALSKREATARYAAASGRFVHATLSREWHWLFDDGSDWISVWLEGGPSPGGFQSWRHRIPTMHPAAQNALREQPKRPAALASAACGGWKSVRSSEWEPTRFVERKDGNDELYGPQRDRAQRWLAYPPTGWGRVSDDPYGWCTWDATVLLLMLDGDVARVQPPGRDWYLVVRPERWQGLLRLMYERRRAAAG